MQPNNALHVTLRSGVRCATGEIDISEAKVEDQRFLTWEAFQAAYKDCDLLYAEIEEDLDSTERSHSLLSDTESLEVEEIGIIERLEQHEDGDTTLCEACGREIALGEMVRTHVAWGPCTATFGSCCCPVLKAQAVSACAGCGTTTRTLHHAVPYDEDEVYWVEVPGDFGAYFCRLCLAKRNPHTPPHPDRLQSWPDQEAHRQP